MRFDARVVALATVVFGLLGTGCANRLDNMELLPAYCEALDGWASSGLNQQTRARMLTIYNPVEERVVANWETQLGHTAGCFDRDCLDDADRVLVRSIMRLPNYEDTVWFADAADFCTVADRVAAEWYECSSGSSGCTRLEVVNDQ